MRFLPQECRGRIRRRLALHAGTSRFAECPEDPANERETMLNANAAIPSIHPTKRTAFSIHFARFIVTPKTKAIASRPDGLD